MTEREALRLALKALEIGLPLIEDFGSTEQFNAQHKAITAIYEALAQPEPEYLAFMDTPQRKPLTDEEIRDLWSWSATAEAERTATTQQHAFARAIEAAHGIKGEA